MKILMINHFPLAGSGSGTYTRNLAVHLAALGHQVTVILPENTDDFEEVPGVRLHPVFFSAANDHGVPEAVRRASAKSSSKVPDDQNLIGSGKTMADPLPFNFPCFTTHPRSTVSFGDLTEEQLEQYKAAFSCAIDDEIRRDQPDVIHGQHVWILPALAAGRGIPLILTAHGTDLMGYNRWPELRKYADLAMYDCFSVISISKDNCELIRELFPYAADKIVMMRNGYDPTIFYPEKDGRTEVLSSYGISEEEQKGRRIICFAGKLAHFKGVDVLLEALRLIDDQSASGAPGVFTIIAGDGEERDALRKEVGELALKHVRFIGNVDSQALRKLYNIADVSVVPSRREPFGLVALEAMACGTPVIASDQGGLPDFVNDSVGGLAKPEDPEDLASELLSVIERADEEGSGWRKTIAEYARTHYAQDTIIRELDTLYKASIQDR
ncbi:MAG: glycosyltransferase family 4 protein [Eubacterium sp.]|nr:glycosyltransferase family 4 protein [Eubacterium sp.]